MALNQQGAAGDLTKVNTPVNAVEFTPLSTTNTVVGGWIDISGLKSSTLFVKGLETAGTVKVEVGGGTAAPTNGAILATLSPDANNCAQLTLAGYHWIRVSKTQGTTPTASVVTLYGLLF